MNYVPDNWISKSRDKVYLPFEWFNAKRYLLTNTIHTKIKWGIKNPSQWWGDMKQVFRRNK